MVDTDTHPPQTATIDLGGPLFAAAVAGAVAQRINRGDLDLADPWSLPEVVTGLVVELVTQVNADRIAALQEQVRFVTAERDAANDAVNELVQQVDEARAGREDTPIRVYESTEAFLAHLDELTANLERGDGKPETDADTRFFALRESGYTGPVDQDGHRVDDVDTWIDQQLHGGTGVEGGVR